MAKPRVFISSTYYDLRWIRNSIEQFIETMGYEATVFESGDIPFNHKMPLDESCYKEIEHCHMLILIIGGRYGTASSDNRRVVDEKETDPFYRHYNSITKKEYIKARDHDIPIFIFVERSVLAEYETYKNNRDSKVAYAHVDSVNIFRLLDDIYSESRNNLVKGFGTADDITAWLRDQWAGLLAGFIANQREQLSVGALKAEISSLTAVVDALKTYTQSMVRTVDKENSAKLIEATEGTLKQKQADSIILMPHLFRHLVELHSFFPNEIREALKASPGWPEFVQKLKARHDLNCSYFNVLTYPSMHDLHTINVVRHMLGVPPWKIPPPESRQGLGAKVKA